MIYDDYRAGMDVGKYLGESGVSDAVLLWVGEEDPSVGKERRAGVLDGLKLCAVPDPEVVVTTFFYGDVVESMRRFLEQRKLPDAFICATDRIAEGVYKALRERGIKVGEQVSVIGFGDYETNELLVPPLASVAFDWQRFGEVSAETMMQMIVGRPVSEVQIISHKLIQRASVRGSENMNQ